MRYASPQPLRRALEDRLRTRSIETGLSLDRLRRRVMFERILARLEEAGPEHWVLKGGMALEVRLGDAARLTRDIDLGFRGQVPDGNTLHEMLVDALSADPDGDGFVLRARSPVPLQEDGSGPVTWRAKVAAELADKPFGGIQLDVSPRAYELRHTERVPLPNSLGFAGIRVRDVEIVDVHRHAAEKFHAMCRDFGDRENTRVRDLADLVIMIEHGLLTLPEVSAAVRLVWSERDGGAPPEALPALPTSWLGRYERMAAELDVDTTSFTVALARLTRLWREIVAAQGGAPRDTAAGRAGPVPDQA